jgi:hypothetical protein
MGEPAPVATSHQSGPLARIWQVLRTYPRRWHFFICLGVLVNYLVLLPAQSKKFPVDNFLVVALLMFMGMVVAALTMGLIEHLKEQFADWRPRLYPGFRFPHLLPAIIFLLLVSMLVPARTSYALRLDYLPLMAISATVAAAIGWAGYWRSIWTLLPIIFIACSFASEDVRDEVSLMLDGQRLRLAWILIVIDSFALASLFYRLATLHEGRREFLRATANWNLRAAMTGDPSMREFASGGSRDSLAMSLLRYTDRLVIGAPLVFNAAFRWRVRHWRMVTLNGWIARSLGVAAILLTALMLALILVWSSNRRIAQTLQPALVLLVPCMILAPPLIVGIVWPRRWISIAYEASLPLTRRALVRQLGTAMLRDHLSIWFWATLTGSILWTMSVSWAISSSVVPNFPQWTILFSNACFGGWFLLGVTQVLPFGMILWALRFRSGIVSLLILFPVAAATLAPIILSGWFYQLVGYQAVAAFLAALVLGGVLLTINSYSWWLRADLD